MSSKNPTSFGGRWSAVYSVWSYFHRLLHVFNISSIDHEEVALLSAPLVRIHTASLPPRVLAHTYSPLAPSEPLGLVAPSTALPHESLFLLHFTPSPTGARADCARIATAHPTATSPRAWIAVDNKTGALALTAAEKNGAVFELRPDKACTRPRRQADVAIAFPCAAGTYLGAAAGESSRARVCVGPGYDRCDGGASKRDLFSINAVASRPGGELVAGEEVVDETLLSVLRGTMELPVQIQSLAQGWFVVSSPGTEIAASKKKDAGWNTFTLEFDYATRMARVRDERGLYLVLSPGKMGFEAGITVDGQEGYTGDGDLGNERPVDGGKRPASPPSSTCSGSLKNEKGEGGFSHGSLVRAERFLITVSGEDDCVTLRSRKGYLSARRNGTVGISQNTIPGRCEHFFLRLARPSMMDQSSVSLRLRHHPHGVREVDGSIVIPCQASVAYDVLRDYNNFKHFIDDCSASELVGQDPDDGRLIVRMAQAHSFLILTLKMTMTLGVVEDDVERKVMMDLIHGLGVKIYKGVWQAAERSDGRCRLSVRISSSPAVPAPNFLVDGVITHAVASTLEQLRMECIMRSTGSSTPSKNTAHN